jgi:dCMP deaminase
MGADKQERWLQRAEQFATWSKDPSTKVACILVREQHAVGEGYNGFPHGVDDSDARLLDRATKYDWTIHAEANAVAHAARYGHATQGATAYVTFPPCPTCATLLIQAGVRAVVVRDPRREQRSPNGYPLGDQHQSFDERWEARWAVSQTILSEAGVPVLFL